MAAHFPPSTPGKAYYSNTNYRLLGAVIETVTGRSMAENFAEMICAPLGLQHTYLYDWSVPRPGQTPAYHRTERGAGRSAQVPSSNTSDGGLVSTVSEGVSFLRAFFEARLFDRALLDRMTRWNAISFRCAMVMG